MARRVLPSTMANDSIWPCSDLKAIDVLQAARKIVCLVLIIHGDADEVVPVEAAHELNAYLAGRKKLMIMKGTDHRLSNPVMIQLALS